MKFILHALGTSGDVFPVMGLAKSLLLAKYDVVVLSNEKFRCIADKEGIPFYSTGGIGEYCAGNTSEIYRSGSWDSQVLYYILPAFKPSFDYVHSEYRENKNIIVISSCKSNGARAAADILSISVVDLVISPASLLSVYDLSAPFCWYYKNKFPFFIQRWLLSKAFKKLSKICIDYSITVSVNKARRALGALPYGKNNKKIENLSFGLFPEWFSPRAKDWPSHFQSVGFPLACFSKSNDELVRKFIGENGPPIVFYFGSGAHDLYALQEHCFKICSQLKVSAIFLGPSEDVVIKRDGLNHLLLAEMDFSVILKMCRAIVHHGGIGTVSQAINARIPQLIRPLRPDHINNAYRVKLNGFGDYLLPRDFRVVDAAKKLGDLLSVRDAFNSLDVSEGSLDGNSVFDRIVLEIEKVYVRRS
ncbi:glycosyltransferase [Cellvibrio polysaccharolyticus]|nr:nucleotide disphospho-sugar-binding domain-containing protein [Cellvibrio polysaccharolyticus]